MRLKIFQEMSLTKLEESINAWLEDNPNARVLEGIIQYQGNWRTCYAVMWYRLEGEKSE